MRTRRRLDALSRRRLSGLPRLRTRTRRMLRLYTWAVGAAAALGWFVVPLLTGEAPEAPGLLGVLVAVVFVGMLIAVGMPGGRRAGDGARSSRDARSSSRRAA